MMEYRGSSGFRYTVMNDGQRYGSRRNITSSFVASSHFSYYNNNNNNNNNYGHYPQLPRPSPAFYQPVFPTQFVVRRLVPFPSLPPAGRFDCFETPPRSMINLVPENRTGQDSHQRVRGQSSSPIPTITISDCEDEESAPVVEVAAETEDLSTAISSNPSLPPDDVNGNNNADNGRLGTESNLPKPVEQNIFGSSQDTAVPIIVTATTGHQSQDKTETGIEGTSSNQVEEISEKISPDCGITETTISQDSLCCKDQRSTSLFTDNLNSPPSSDSDMQYRIIHSSYFGPMKVKTAPENSGECGMNERIDVRKRHSLPPMRSTKSSRKNPVGNCDSVEQLSLRGQTKDPVVLLERNEPEETKRKLVSRSSLPP